MKTKILISLSILILTACNGASIPPYRWHKTGMSENDVARQQRICVSQAKHDTKKDKTPKSLEQCMDEAGYYRYVTGNM